jgi:hypothetical protein
MDGTKLQLVHAHHISPFSSWVMTLCWTLKSWSNRGKHRIQLHKWRITCNNFGLKKTQDETVAEWFWGMLWMQGLLDSIWLLLWHQGALMTPSSVPKSSKITYFSELLHWSRLVIPFILSCKRQGWWLILLHLETKIWESRTQNFKTSSGMSSTRLHALSTPKQRFE